jgi:hypothetical protein
MLTPYVKGVNILSLDAKDIYIANHYNKPNPIGYNIRYKNGDINLRKFINVLDYSKDLIKLREVYQKVYRRKDFSFFLNDKEYTQKIINVTFKYSNKEFNRINGDTYVKFGFNLNDITLNDCVCVIDNQLVAVKVNVPVDTPISKSELGNYFYYDEGVYKAKSNFKVVDTVASLREKLYKEGFYCDGIHYVRFKRSNGSSRVGKCLFIDENLYMRMFKWGRCGLKVTEGQAIDLPGFESYIALTQSSMIDTISIPANSILVIDDYESVFKDKVMATRIKDSKLVTQPEEVEIHNSIWDGQSLMDKSLFGKYESKGFLLLRNRFFKSACFNTNVQQWFKDNGITDVSQVKGFTLAKRIEDIKFITTPSSIKYLKFGTLEEWFNNLEEDFGVVKFDKQTHYMDGKLVQTHYQLVNTLQLSKEEIKNFLQPSFDYINAISQDAAVMRYHIKCTSTNALENPMLTKNDIVYNLMNLNEKFCDTKIYKDFLDDTVYYYKDNMKQGHILVNGNYSTLVGNPIEMLLASIGKFDGTSQLGKGNIHSKRFEYGKPILGSRSPHCCMGNVWVANNAENSEIDKYFNFTKEIVCLNSINENVLQRLNGCD